MKINIQNIERDLFEIDEDVDIDFLPEELSSFYPGAARVHVVLDKFSTNYRLKIQASMNAHYVCDRCLIDYTEERIAKQSQIFHLGEAPPDADADILYLEYGSKEIDLTPLLKEMIVLQHPIKMLCKEDCKGLCPHCGADLNKEQCQCADELTDPRWEKLRKLIK